LSKRRSWRTSSSARPNIHRDHWHAAEELYEKLPLVGGLMRWFKKRARQKSA